MDIVESIYGLLGLILVFWFTYAAFKVSKPLAVGVFFIRIFFFPYFAIKYWEEAREPANLFLFIFLSSLIIVGLEYAGLI